MTAHRLAVDLGSSNTVAVLRSAGGPARSLLFDGSELLPSGIFAQADGRLLTGHDAERLARGAPAGFEPHPKRRVDDGALLLGARHVDVRDALAAVLTRVHTEAGISTGELATVLSCPTGWGEPRRRILTDAAARAGLGQVDTVSEAIAAAAYFSTVLTPHPRAGVAIVDIGGGTTDIAVVNHAPDPEVIAQAGVDLGGADIDAALLAYIAEQSPLPNLGDPGYDPLLLWQEIRLAKESLSRLSHTPLRIPGRPGESHLTREELETVAAPILTTIGELAAEVIMNAGLSPDRLAGVLLVGGGSRIPLAAHVLHTRLGVAPTTVERPETVVVEGTLLVTPTRSMASTAPASALAPPTSTPPPPADQADAPVPSVKPPPVRGRRGWLRPVLLAAVLLCFALPFATVSCGLPDGYGRADAGGTTTYRGATLLAGTAPQVTSGHLVPEAQWRPDRLAPQPLLIMAMLVVVAALVVAVRSYARRSGQPDRSGPDSPRPPPTTLAWLTVAAAVLLMAGELVTLHLLELRVAADSTVPVGKTARDFVATGTGYWLALILLAAVVAIELWPRRPRGPGRGRRFRTAVPQSGRP